MSLDSKGPSPYNGRGFGVSRSGCPSAILAACLASVWLAPGHAQAQEFEKGKLVETVLCLADPGQSYALYLPSAFDPKKKWPILYLFDPGARGSAGVGAFRAAAEDHGWILVGSNNSRNGPLEESVREALALWADTQRRLPVDERRIYAAGFSGGARVASILPRIIAREIAGIIGCGAGLSRGITPEDLKAGAYFGLTGLADFNYEEMKNLDLAFDPAGVTHRFLFFEGRHDWPVPSNCARALGWLEVVAMKTGLRQKDETLAEAVIGRELNEARSFEEAGRNFWAIDRLEAAGRLAGGFREIPGLAARIDSLKARREYGQFLTAERMRAKRAESFRGKFSRTFGAVEANERVGRAVVLEVLKEMGIGSLKREAKNKRTLEDRSLASRLLFDFSFAAQSRAMELYGKDDLIRSAAYLDLAIAACEEGLPRERSLYLTRACVAALAGDKKRALDLLAAAVDKGFTDVDVLETAKALDVLKDTDEFREILEKARTNSRR